MKPRFSIDVLCQSIFYLPLVSTYVILALGQLGVMDSPPMLIVVPLQLGLLVVQVISALFWGLGEDYEPPQWFLLLMIFYIPFLVLMTGLGVEWWRPKWARYLFTLGVPFLLSQYYYLKSWDFTRTEHPAPKQPPLDDVLDDTIE